MAYLSCDLISNMYLNINGRIDKGDRVITLCCENISSAPGVNLTDNVDETLERFVGLRTMLLAQGLRTPEKNDYGCAGCSKYRKGEWSINPFIGYVNLSMYPAPCQCKCCYCSVDKKWIKSLEVELAYNKMFELLERAESTGLIDPDAYWQISSGEITIHPYKDRIYKLVKNKTACFYTNAFIYDEEIATNLQNNSKSAINLSIDAGTPATWAKVKGVDNFDAVTDNLVKYYSHLSRSGQIALKYIVLPGINDNLADYKSVIEIMKIIGTNHLTISRDVSKKYCSNDTDYKQLILSAAYLLALLSKNGMSSDMFTYTEEERLDVIEVAEDLLKNKNV